MFPDDWPYDPRDRIRFTCTIEGHSFVLSVDSTQCGSDPIRVALPPDLSVGNDVYAGSLHIGYGEKRCVVLGIFQKGLFDSP